MIDSPSGEIEIRLRPLNKTLRAPSGAALQDLLFAEGVEFPCGGRGRCKGCRVKVLAGALPAGEDDRRQLTPAEIADGWRLACRARVHTDLTLELAQWETPILADDSPVAATPREGWGAAVDVGTTTVVAQLLDLSTGRVLGVRTALNSQAQHGADVMSRVDFAMAASGQSILQRQIRTQLGRLLRDLLDAAAAANPAGAASSRLKEIVLAGNTVMHHLFCGIDVAPMARHPFEPESPGPRRFSAAELGWDLPGTPMVRFLPCLGGFVGGDILAGILATRLHESAAPAALIDLGTNGEIVVGSRAGLLCASPAAGPAFEGARISTGMRAATGAISQVALEQGRLRCHVLGHAAARGICGSGLVDAVAAGLELGRISPSGRLLGGESFALTPSVSLNQKDIRELQLAKGAIAAGLRLLLAQYGVSRESLTRVFLAGAFGNYINLASARRIGLLDFPPDRTQPSGNTSLRGAKLALCGPDAHQGAYPELLARIRHLPLNEDPNFQDAFAEEMTFPGARD